MKYEGWTASIDTGDDFQWSGGTSPPQWTRDLPTEPGWYALAEDGHDWVGCEWVERMQFDSDIFARRGIRKGDLFIDSESSRRVDAYKGWWLKIELPPVPDDDGGKRMTELFDGWQASEGWQWMPERSKYRHYFVNGRSLCGHWENHSTVFDGEGNDLRLNCVECMAALQRRVEVS